MIVTKPENLKNYEGISKYAKEIEAFISSSPSCGKHEFDKDNFFATVSKYITEDEKERKFESHLKYIDVQYLLTGKEILNWAETESLDITENNFINGGDCSFYSGKTQASVILGNNVCAVLFPEDAHMPCVKFEEKAEVTKIVFKIKL